MGSPLQDWTRTQETKTEMCACACTCCMVVDDLWLISLVTFLDLPTQELKRDTTGPRCSASQGARACTCCMVVDEL